MSSKLSTFRGALMLATSMLGFGILCIPKAVAQVGLINSIILTIGMTILSFNSFFLYFKVCKRKSDEKGHERVSFSDLIGNNVFLFIFVNLMTAFICFGGITAFSKTLGNYAVNLINLEQKYSFIFALGFAIMQFGISFLKDLSFLSYASTLSMTSCFLVGGVIIFYYFSLKKDEIVIEKFNYNFQDAAGSFIFSLFCQTLIPTVYSSLRKGSSIFNVSILASVMGGCLVLFYGIFGYLTGGRELSTSKVPDILSFYSLKTTSFSRALEFSFDKNGYLIKVSQIFFILLLNCTYIFLFVPGRQSILEIFNKFTDMNDQKPNISSIFSIFVSTIFIFGGLFFSRLKISDNIVTYSGLYLMNTLGFILPGVLYLRTYKFANVMLGFLSVFEIMSGLGLIVILSYFRFKS